MNGRMNWMHWAELDWCTFFYKNLDESDLDKVDALYDSKRPRNKEELKSFLAMMQNNSDFIERFSQWIAQLRNLPQKSQISMHK